MKLSTGLVLAAVAVTAVNASLRSGDTTDTTDTTNANNGNDLPPSIKPEDLLIDLDDILDDKSTGNPKHQINILELIGDGSNQVSMDELNIIFGDDKDGKKASMILRKYLDEKQNDSTKSSYNKYNDDLSDSPHQNSFATSGNKDDEDDLLWLDGAGSKSDELKSLYKQTFSNYKEKDSYDTDSKSTKSGGVYVNGNTDDDDDDDESTGQKYPYSRKGSLPTYGDDDEDSPKKDVSSKPSSAGEYASKTSSDNPANPYGNDPMIDKVSLPSYGDVSTKKTPLSYDKDDDDEEDSTKKDSLPYDEDDDDDEDSTKKDVSSKPSSAGGYASKYDSTQTEVDDEIDAGLNDVYEKSSVLSKSTNSSGSTSSTDSLSFTDIDKMNSVDAEYDPKANSKTPDSSTQSLDSPTQTDGKDTGY